LIFENHPYPFKNPPSIAPYLIIHCFNLKIKVMKKSVLIAAWFVFSSIAAQTQVTQINSNKSLKVSFPLSNSKGVLVSSIDSTLWVTDGTLGGTIQISTDIKYESAGQLLAGKLIFRGNTASTGSEIFITDGTTLGTVLIKDINGGATGSNPGDFVLMNGFVYFSAVTAAEGRELWKTNGTFDGTKILKDIVPGPDSSNNLDKYQLFSAGNYLLFAANTASTGIELWVSNGSTIGTDLLADINFGNGGADSSNPAHFFTLNGLVLFTASAATSGNEIWKTDGTLGGTLLLKDINPGPAGCTEIELFPGLSVPLFLGFHAYNNQAFFQANDGSSTGELWITDGTTANTVQIKNIVATTGPSIILLADAVNLPGKFIFPITDLESRSELWESDGTPGGTVLFKSFNPITPGEIPEILIPYTSNIETGTYSQTLFQGKNFFFTGGTVAEGYELWMSDGSLTGTALIKDINPGANNGLDPGSLSYLYTSAGMFFSANDGVNGLEL
jgi:ELWxxDGT repeat protein